MNRVKELTEAYHLCPHPEGGSFAEAWSSSGKLEGRPLAGSIYFLLNGAEISHLHVIDCDEVWYYHEGCGLELTLITPEGERSSVRLGSGPETGENVMAAIPAGVMFAARNLDPTGYTFVSCVTAPHFTYEGFRLIGMQELRRICPESAEKMADLVIKGEYD